jgi:hypothetical protein
MVRFLGSFQSVFYLFLVHHKHEGRKVGGEEDGARHKSKVSFDLTVGSKIITQEEIVRGSEELN